MMVTALIILPSTILFVFDEILSKAKPVPKEVMI